MDLGTRAQGCDVRCLLGIEVGSECAGSGRTESPDISKPPPLKDSAHPLLMPWDEISCLAWFLNRRLIYRWLARALLI